MNIFKRIAKQATIQWLHTVSQPMTGQSHPELHRLFERQCRQFGIIPVPEIRIVQDIPAAGAYTHPPSRTIYYSNANFGALDTLEEHLAALFHEAAYIRYGHRFLIPSRRQDLEADNLAIQMCGNPEHLATALEKIAWWNQQKVEQAKSYYDTGKDLFSSRTFTAWAARKSRDMLSHQVDRIQESFAERIERIRRDAKTGRDR